MVITLSGTDYDVAHTFGEARVLISFNGLYVFADLVGGAWELSGLPARPDEMAILKALTDPTNDQTIVTVTKND